MIAAAIGLIILGVVLLFLIPLGGILVGIVGLVLLAIFLVGLARERGPADPRA